MLYRKGYGRFGLCHHRTKEKQVSEPDYIQTINSKIPICRLLTLKLLFQEKKNKHSVKKSEFYKSWNTKKKGEILWQKK